VAGRVLKILFSQLFAILGKVVYNFHNHSLMETVVLQVNEYLVWGDHPEPFSVGHDPENSTEGPHFFIIDQCGVQLFATIRDLELLTEAAKCLWRAHVTRKPEQSPQEPSGGDVQARTPEPAKMGEGEQDLEAAAGKLLASVDQLLSSGESHCLQTRADALRHILYRRARKNCLSAISDGSDKSH
jgi:hypothetical protein